MTMNEKEEKKSISDTVLDKIKEGEIKMRPKIYFVFRAILLATGVVAVFFFSFYLVSFIVFILRATSIFSLPRFGFSGMKTFIVSFPWFLILVVLLFIWLLELLAKRFASVYRRPLIYSVFAIVVLIFIGGLVIYPTRFHENMFLRAREDRLPIMGGFYRGMGKFPNTTHGIVSEIEDNSFIIEQSDGQSVVVIITSDTILPFKNGIKEGDVIMVFGEQNKNGVINARGIQKIDKEFDFFPKHPESMPFPPIR